MGGRRTEEWERAAPSKRRLRRFLRPVVQVAAVAVVAVFFYRERHVFTGFGSTMSRLRWSWVGLAFAAELASIPALAEAQIVVLRAGGVRADRVRMNMVTLASNAISLSVPAGVAFAEGYSFARYREFGASAAVAAWSELAAGAIAFAALAGVALAGAVIDSQGAAPILLPTLSVVLAGAAGAAELFRHPEVLVRATEWIERHVGRRVGALVGRVTERVRDAARSLGGVHPPVRTWAAAAGLSTANWLLDVACLAWAFRAVGARVPWAAVLLAFAGGKVVSSIGITPGGLGLVEGGLVATFVAYGTPGATAGAAVLVYRALTLVGLVAIGWAAVAVLAVQSRRD